MGIGHTAAACVELGVDFVGFETDADYCAQSRQTMETATERKAAELFDVSAS